MNKNDLSRIAAEVAGLASEITSASPCLVQGKIQFQDGGKSVVLKANSEGFVHLASIFLSLADKAKQHSHFHFDASSVPESPDFDFIVVFDDDPEGLGKIRTTANPTS